MTQPFLHDLGVHTSSKQVCGVTVPEVVKPDARQSRLPDEAFEITLHQVVGVKRFAVRLAENQVVIFVT